MRFDSVNNTGKKFILPRVAFQLANFKEGDMLDLNINDDIVVVLKKNMNAMELINAAATLHTLYMELTDHLVDVCGDCEECFDTCPAEDVHKERISLPDYLLREAGIPVGSKLWASVDEAQGIIKWLFCAMLKEGHYFVFKQFLIRRKVNGLHVL